MEIRNIKKTEWNDVRDFNSVQYGPKHILTNKIYYDWMFDNVFNKSKSEYTSLGLFDKNQELVGTIGLFPAPCSFFGETVVCNWIANLIVKEQLRKLGYGYLLLEKSVLGADLGVDHNINDQAWPLFTKSGWNGTDIQRHVCVLDKFVLEKLIGKKTSNIKVFKNILPDQNDLSFQKIERFGNEFNVFWKTVKNRFPITIERTAKYLNWRYSDCKLVKYHIFKLKKGNQIKAFLVLRIEEVTEGLDKKPTGIKIGRIVDLMSDASNDKVVLLNTIKFCIKQNAGLVDFFFTGNFFSEALKTLNFVNCDTSPYNLIPTLLNPINRTKRTKNNFAFKLLNKKNSAKNYGNFNNWYTTKGGGDQDRPY